jgi:hypothetical protein
LRKYFPFLPPPGTLGLTIQKMIGCSSLDVQTWQRESAARQEELAALEAGVAAQRLKLAEPSDELRSPSEQI